jgi:hypothetical protein
MIEGLNASGVPIIAVLAHAWDGELKRNPPTGFFRGQ